MNALTGTLVLVLGLGESGLAMARWCARGGAAVHAWDSRDDAPNDAALLQHVPGAVRLRGALDATVLDGVSRVLKSPGLFPSDPALAAVLAAAAERGIPVQGEVALFSEALAALAARAYRPKVIAVTGTNGKTTTTAMTAALVARSGRSVAAAGNIGPTMLQTLADAIDAADAAVLQHAEADAAADVALAAAAAERHAAAVAAALEAARGVAGTGAHVDADADADLEEEGTAGDGDAGADAPAAAASQRFEAGIEAETAAEAHADSDVQANAAASDAQPDAPSAFAAAAEAEAEAEAEAIAPLPAIAPPTKPEFDSATLRFAASLPQVWVLELSSFQLDGVNGFTPDAAVVLNITQDHLDWHGSMAAYAEAKSRVYGGAGARTVMVVNGDDPLVEAMVPAPPAPAPRPKRGAAPVAEPPRRPVVRFTLAAPTRAGDYGLVSENGIAWLVRAVAGEIVRKVRGRPEPEVEIHIQRLMPADALRVRGRHNAANALASLALANAVGCALAPMLHALRDYAGEPHRVETVATVSGVDAIDDSKGTNVGATVAAIRGLGADRAPSRLVVILGGDGKGQDFTPLAEPLRRHARAVATIGRDAAAIEAVAQAALEGRAALVQRHDTLEAATRWAFEQAEPGDAVLLSPACASLDMFRNYGHRAQVFVDAVHELAAERGEVLA